MFRFFELSQPIFPPLECFLSKAIAGPVYWYLEDRWPLKNWEVKMSKEHLDSICFDFEEGDMKAWKVWTVLAIVLYYLLRPL